MLRVGLIGCGRISDIYIQNCQSYNELQLVGCASLDMAESREKARQYDIGIVCSADELISHPDIDCILNLTVPSAHTDIALAALESGKHVFSEKPFATDLAQGRAVLKRALDNQLLVGNAPDTFLGGRWQTCRALIDSGVIGMPTGVAAFVGTHGVERHNPNPDFYYLEGGGPMLDLGPYYVTAMVSVLGPISRVCGLSRKTFSERMIENGHRSGEMIPVEVDTHTMGMIEFESGVIGSITMSFDIWDSETPRFEIYGEEGTLCIPDPDPVHGANQFGGEVWYRTRENSRWAYQPRVTGKDSWTVAENCHGYNDNSRGLGLLDLAVAVKEKRQPRASGELAYHVSEALTGILEAPARGGYIDIASTCQRPDPLPQQFP